jgi:phage portal protein BeeE
MGYISRLSKSLGNARLAKDQASKERWRRTFSITSKEDPHERNYGAGIGPEGTGIDPRNFRTNVGTPAAIQQLLRALRSLAPGGWTDNRWEQTSHWVGIAYVAGHRICEQMLQSEFQVLETDPQAPDGIREVSPDHPLVQLLKKPNYYDSFGDHLYRITQQLLLTGTCLTWMVPNKFGTPVELYSIPTAMAIPQSNLTPDYPHGYYRVQPVYPYGPFTSYPTPLSAAGALIPAQWMLRIQFPHPLLRYEGYSPLSGLRLHLDEVEAIDRARWYSQRRAINPSAVLNFDAELGAEPLPEAEIARIHAEFENDQQGPENTGRLFVATPGAKLEPWGAPPKDMEYQSGWTQLVEFCLAGMGITKEAAGMVSDSTYSTLFATLKQFHMLTLEPICHRFATSMTKHLAPFYGENLIIKIRTQRIDDHDIKMGKVNALMNARAITKNEIRKAFDFDFTNEDWGKEIAGDQRQLGMPEPAQQPGQPGAEQSQAPPENGPPGTGAMTAAMGGPAESPPEPPKLGGEREEEANEPQEIGITREKPGNLAAGSLGPRKSFGGRLTGIHNKPKVSSYQIKSFLQGNKNHNHNGKP